MNSEIKYKDVVIELSKLNKFVDLNQGYTISNGDFKPFFMARVGEGLSFGRNSASAIRGAEKLIDDQIAASIFVFNPNTRRKAGRAKEERGGGRRTKVRGKKV